MTTHTTIDARYCPVCKHATLQPYPNTDPATHACIHCGIEFQVVKVGECVKKPGARR